MTANYAVLETLPDEMTKVLNAGRYVDMLVREDGKLRLNKSCVYDSVLCPTASFSCLNRFICDLADLSAANIAARRSCLLYETLVKSTKYEDDFDDRRSWWYRELFAP